MRIALHTPALAAEGTPSLGAAAACDALSGALTIGGHQVEGPGLPGAADGDVRQVLQWASRPGRRPDIWLTYGLRPDAPDTVGAEVASALKIPYVLVDPRGPDDGTAMTAGPVATVIALTDASVFWAEAALPDTPVKRLLPFIDPGPYDAVRRLHAPQAAMIAGRHHFDPEAPKLLFVGSMRAGDRLDSCRQLARALSRLVMLDWQMIVIGDGPERDTVLSVLRRLPLGRVHMIGALPPDEVVPYYAISDILVAPCVGGTHGRVLLEAQATGLPVVAGDTPGVRDVVRDGMTGRIYPAGNAESLGQAIAFLLRERRFLAAYASATVQSISKDHHIVPAANALGAILGELADVDF